MNELSRTTVSKNMLPFRGSQTDLVRFWVIASITISIIGITYVSMAAGYGTVVPQLFYFPILYATYFYPQRGLYVACSCAAAYLLIAAFFITPEPFAIGGVLFQAMLFIVIAVGSVIFLKHRQAGAFASVMDDAGEVQAMITMGENDRVEFKRHSLWSMALSKDEMDRSESAEVRRYRNKTSKYIIARSIAGFLNSDGGDLLIGIDEDRITNTVRVVGIEGDYALLHEKDRNPDGYRRMIVDSIVRKYLPEVYDSMGRFIHLSFPVISGMTVCRVHVSPSDKPVFVDIGNEELFYIRIDASTRMLSGKTLTNYILTRFSSP